MTLTQRIDALMAEADAHIRRAENLPDETERTAATAAANDCMERAEKLTDQSQSGAADPQLESLIRRADMGEIVNCRDGQPATRPGPLPNCRRTAGWPRTKCRWRCSRRGT